MTLRPSVERCVHVASRAVRLAREARWDDAASDRLEARMAPQDVQRRLSTDEEHPADALLVGALEMVERGLRLAQIRVCEREAHRPYELGVAPRPRQARHVPR